MKVFFSFCFSLFLLASVAVVASSIEERLAPVGKLCLAGDPCASSGALASSGPRTGESIYSSACSACHSIGVAGAPKFGDKAAWQPRIDRGVESLYTNAINGLNGMPPRGTCGDCSDDEIRLAVDHMVGAL